MTSGAPLQLTWGCFIGNFAELVSHRCLVLWCTLWTVSCFFGCFSAFVWPKVCMECACCGALLMSCWRRLCVSRCWRAPSCWYGHTTAPSWSWPTRRSAICFWSVGPPPNASVPWKPTLPMRTTSPPDHLHLSGFLQVWQLLFSELHCRLTTTVWRLRSWPPLYESSARTADHQCMKAQQCHLTTSVWRLGRVNWPPLYEGSAASADHHSMTAQQWQLTTTLRRLSSDSWPPLSQKGCTSLFSRCPHTF